MACARNNSYYDIAYNIGNILFLKNVKTLWLSLDSVFVMVVFCSVFELWFYKNELKILVKSSKKLYNLENKRKEVSFSITKSGERPCTKTKNLSVKIAA